jgi:uridine kinase
MNIVQVVGGPGSGKTTLAFKLLEDWPGTASLLRIDRYLRNKRPDDGEDFLVLPTSIDWPLLRVHLDLLATGNSITVPTYDWERGRRLTTPDPVPPEQVVTACDWLIIEGLYYVPQLPSIRLFVDAPADVRRERSSALETRLSRSLEGVYEDVADPAYEGHIAPQRERAHYVLDGSLDRDRLADRARAVLAAHLTGWG